MKTLRWTTVVFVSIFFVLGMGQAWAVCPPLSITSSTLSQGTQGQAYSYQLQTSGGWTPISFSLAGGSLPPGLNLNSGGVISGTPTASGTYTFVVKAIDSCPPFDGGPQWVQKSFSLTINPQQQQCPALSITSPSLLPAGTVGQAYTYQIQTSGGQPPITFQKIAGSLPPGLNLSSSGVISGTPTAAGTYYTFNVKATDTCQAGTQTEKKFFYLTIKKKKKVVKPPIERSKPDTTFSEVVKVVTCAGKVATIVGTPGNDVLNGTPGDDVIAGLGGDDKIYGLSGNDIICGGPGNDEIWGYSGNDRLEGGTGNDELHGGPGIDSDYLLGGPGNDVLKGDDGNDKLFGGNGDDTLYGGKGNDVLKGGGGNDYLDSGSGNNEMWGQEGNDQLIGYNGHDFLHGGYGNDHLDGGFGFDTLFGGHGNDVLKGGPGNDKLHGNEETDHCDGGSGTDKEWDCEQIYNIP